MNLSQEMYQLAKVSRQDILEKEYDDIIDKIKKYANEGKFVLNFKGLSSTTLSRLKENGFRISGTYVSWESDK